MAIIIKEDEACDILTNLKNCKVGDKVTLLSGKPGIIVHKDNFYVKILLSGVLGKEFITVCYDTVVRKKVKATEITFLRDTFPEDVLSKNILLKGDERMIKNYKIYKGKDGRDKVVVVSFADGTEERAVCCEEDTFDLERGVEICVMKHLFGDRYKNMISDAMKEIKAIDKEKEAKKKEEAEIAAKKAKAARKKAKRTENLRKKRIFEMEEAYYNALKRVKENA